MRIALCFSGQPRSIKITYDSFLKNLININENVDIFIHTYYTPENVNKEFLISFYNGINRSKKLNCYTIPTILEPNTIEYLEEKYKPKILIHERDDILFKQENYIEDEYFTNYWMTIPFNFQKMIYSIFMSNKIKMKYENENNFKYDAVIRTRFDSIIVKPIHISNLNLDFLNVSQYTYNQISDIFCISNSLNMNKYSDVWNTFKKIYDDGTTMHAEEIFRKHMSNNNLDIIDSLKEHISLLR